MATTDFVVKNGLVVTENAVINEVTDASSKDTGALVVEGGVGIEKKLYVGTDLNVGGNEILTGDLAVNGGDLTTTQTTFNLVNTTATTVNFAGASAALLIGATTGTATIRNASVILSGDLDVRGGDLTTNQSAFNLVNTTATAVNFAGAATSIEIGAATGTTNVNNNLDVDGDVNIDGGDLTVSTGTFNLANATATTINFAGAATDIQIGAASGTTNVNNNLVVDLDLQVKGGDVTTTATTFNLVNTTATTVNFAGAGTNIQIGAATGTTNVNNNLDVDGDVNIDGGDLTVSTGTFNLANTTATAVNAFGAATALSLGATSGTGSTTIKNSLIVDGNTTLGNASGDAVTFNASTINVPNSITVTQDDAVANGVSYPVSFRHTTSGVPLNGIGTGIQLITETAADNFETGAIIESVSTDVTALSEDFDLVFKLMAGGAAPVEKFRIGSNGTITVDAGLVLGSGDLNTTQTTFNLVNNTATTVNFAGAATNIQIGSASGTTNINNSLDVDGDINIDGGDLTVSDTTFNLVNTTATTLNIGGAATLIDIGATTGTTSINNSLDVDGDVNIDGGDLTTNQTSFNLVNTTATTVNFAKAATLVDIGAATGTTSINNNLSVDGTLFVTGDTTFDGDVIPAADNTGVVGTAARTWSNGQFTNLTIDGTLSVLTAIDLADSNVLRFGSSDDVSMFYNGTDNIFDIELEAAATQIDITDNGTTRITFAKTGNITTVGDVAINGGDLTTTATTFNLVNATATTLNFAGAATTLTVGATSGTTNIRNNLNVTGDLDIDGGDLTVSTAAFNLANTVATTLNIGGAATTLTIGATTGTTNIRNNVNVTGDLDIDGGDLTVSTTTFNLANTTATTVNFAGAATNIQIGAATGTTNVNNDLTVDGNTTLGDASGDTVTINASTVNVPNTITIVEDDATANAVSYPVTVSHTTSGVPAVGIGTGLGFSTETAANNNEIGVQIDSVATTITAGAENFSLSLKTMAAGAAPAERVNINSSSVTVNTGLINLTNGTSNRIDWNTSGVAAPTFTTRSAGTKLVLYPAVSVSAVDYAIGMESSTLWTSVPTSGNQFKWYGGTTQAMLLSGTGNLTVSGDVAVNGGDLTTSQTTFNLINSTATTINFGGAADTLNIGKSGGTTVIAGNLTVNGTTTTINTTELTVDDKNIELGSIASPTDVTADGGGITLKGTTDKTFNWVDATDSWTSSEHMDIANGKVYKINQATVLSATALGSGVTSSSLTTVGTIGTGTWQGTIINPTYGGTGINNGGRTITIGGNFTHTGAHNLTLTTTGVTSVTLPTSGTLATTGNLSQFAATTSAQLAGVISDETGTGALVFGTSPTFTTSVLTNSASLAVFNTTATTVNAFGAATTFNIGNSAAAQTVSIGSGSTGASTYNLGTGVTAAATIKTLNIGTGGAASSTTNVNIGSSNGGTITVNSGTLVGAATTQNAFNTVATTLNIGGAATAFNAGATTGTMTLRNPTIVGSQVTQDLFNTTATTINFAGASTALTIGATTGTATIRNATTTMSGNANVNGGTLATSQTTFNLINTTATTLNIGGASTALTIGATTGTTTIRNATTTMSGNANVNGGTLATSQGTFNLINTTATTLNIGGASTALTIGATTGTTTIRNANTVVTGDLAVNGADITTTATGASSIFNANTTTLNLAQAATTITMGATSGTTTIRNNLAVSGNSTLGDASGDTITINASTVNVPNTITTTVDDAVTNNVSYPVKLQHTTTGTPAIGIGTGLQFIAETAANNNEIGAAIEAITTSVTAGSENFDILFKTMAAGAVASTKVWIKSTGDVGVNTNAPGGKFEVNDSTSQAKVIVARGDGTGAAWRGRILSMNSTGDVSAFLGTYNSKAGIHAHNFALSSWTPLYVNTTSGVDGANVYIAGSGNVGIGKETATFKVDTSLGTVSNNITNFGYNVYANATAGIGYSGYNLQLDNSTANATGYLRLARTSSTVYLGLEIGSQSRDGIRFLTGTSTPTEALRIDANGYLTGPTDATVNIKSNVNYISPNGTNNIIVRMTDTDTLSFSGNSGQLFSITDSLTGTIFAVNDISGVPSIEVIDDGTIILAELVGNVLIGTTTDDGVSRLQVAGNVATSGNLAVNGSDITTTSAAFNLLNTAATTLNFAGAATTLTLGATSGTTNIRNNVNITGDLDIDGGDLTVSTTTFNLANATATTLNFGGAATALTIGATTGTATIRNTTVTMSGNANVNGGTLATSQTTFNLVNTTATTLNIGGAATTLTVGATSGTTNIRNNLNVTGDLDIDGGDLTVSTAAFNLANATATTLNFAGASTALTIGATTGTATIRNATVTMSGNANINGGTLATSQTTFNLINTTATTLNIGGAATTLTVGATSGTTSIRNAVTLPFDTTDVIDFTANSTNDNRGISFNSKTALSADFNDGYLRLNNASEFTNGVYIANFLGVGAGANTAYGLTVGGTADNKIVLNNATNPLIKWQEGTTDRFHIQWNATLNAPVFYNQEARDYYIDTASTSNIGVHLRTAGTDRGWVYADSSNQVGFLDAGGSWAIKHVNDNGTYFYTDTETEEFRVGRDTVTGSYGTVQTSSNKGGWGGYSVNGRVVFMHDAGTNWGIFNDVNDHWMIYGQLNGGLELRHSNVTRLNTTTTGVNVTGLLTATTKSFKIDHPTKPGMSLQYACLEGPENGVYVRGKIKDSNVIELPDYWVGLVDSESITVSITAKGRKQDIFVTEIVDNCVYLEGDDIDCFYVVYGERKDVDKLKVEE